MKRTVTISAIAAMLLITLILHCVSGTHLVQMDYVIKSGDTLWNLYTEHTEGIKWHKWLYEMERANGDSDLYSAGAEIILLTSEGSGEGERSY